MNKRIITILISAAMIISATAFAGCDKKTDTGASSAVGSEGTNSSVFELDSSTEGEDSESKASSKDEKKESDSDKKDDKKVDSSKESSKSSSKASSKASSKSSSKASSKKSTDKDTGIDKDKALEIVLANTDYTEEELSSIDENDEYGEEFYNLSFYRNGSYVFYVRKSDGKFFTYEDYNEKYNKDYSKPSDKIDEDKALEIVLANTDYTEDELASIDENDEYGEKFYNLSFYRNGSYVFYVRQSDGKFFTYEDYNEKYNKDYSKPSNVIDEDDALEIVLANTDYTEDELASIDENEEDGDKFYNLSFYRNGSYVFYVRQKDGRFYDYDDFNKAYNEAYDGYVGHD